MEAQNLASFELLLVLGEVKEGMPWSPRAKSTVYS